MKSAYSLLCKLNVSGYSLTLTSKSGYSLLCKLKVKSGLHFNLQSCKLNVKSGYSLLCKLNVNERLLVTS